MSDVRCEHPRCRSRNPKPVWLIDGKKYCSFCGEKIITMQGVDHLRIHRLTDDWKSFPEPDIKYQGKVAHA